MVIPTFNGSTQVSSSLLGSDVGQPPSTLVACLHARQLLEDLQHYHRNLQHCLWRATKKIPFFVYLFDVRPFLHPSWLMTEGIPGGGCDKLASSPTHIANFLTRDFLVAFHSHVLSVGLHFMPESPDPPQLFPDNEFFFHTAGISH